MKKVKGKILGVIGVLAVFGIYYYAALPAFNIHSMEFWILLIVLLVLAAGIYGKIAKVVAQKMHKEKMSGQAVGNAVGHNPISIIIPCHRVVGTNGSLTGYAGGIDKKIALLKHEGVDMTRYFKPKAR